MIATSTVPTAKANNVYRSAPNFCIDKNTITHLAYYDYPHIKRSIKVGDALSLKREEYHTTDKHRVGVYFCGRKLGYWPSPEGKALANMLDKGLKVRGRIVAIQSETQNTDAELVVETFVKK
jgi:hypothetical protein